MTVSGNETSLLPEGTSSTKSCSVNEVVFRSLTSWPSSKVRVLRMFGIDLTLKKRVFIKIVSAYLAWRKSVQESSLTHASMVFLPWLGTMLACSLGAAESAAPGLMFLASIFRGLRSSLMGVLMFR